MTEFLLKRIAEDEQRAKDPQTAYMLHWAECDYYPGEWTGICTCGAVRRLLAECDAKLRIVKLHSRTEYTATPGRHLCQDSMTAPEDCETMLALVTAYAYHPDYREKWA